MHADLSAVVHFPCTQSHPKEILVELVSNGVTKWTCSSDSISSSRSSEHTSRIRFWWQHRQFFSRRRRQSLFTRDRIHLSRRGHAVY